jgi:hypothetical protein
MNTTRTTLTSLLIERLKLWDEIDRAYEDGLVSKCLKAQSHIDNNLAPNIRKEYGL